MSHPSNLGLPTDDTERKSMQLWTFLMEYFPDAFLAVFGVAKAGNDQHNPGQRLHWAREKSTDQMNTAFRHLWDYGRGVKRDSDGQYHLAKAIWRLSAQLQLDIEEDRSLRNLPPFEVGPHSWDEPVVVNHTVAPVTPVVVCYSCGYPLSWLPHHACLHPDRHYAAG